MVYIRKVEIFGFKSFGYRNTVIDFQPGLISLAGANGSGKSNILDAITFATGENKPRTMRVGRMGQLLYDPDGTGSGRGKHPARVSVHLDNADRRIPVDSDLVEISRELDAGGDSVYYLNKKRAPRGHVVDLLDVASARLHQLNAVQQNTITRISDFTPEEKRKSIEDLIGLSEFDERKEKALKELDDADRRLEVALAKMDEIKKQIDELDEERNLKLRHDMIDAEMRRLNAVSASRRLAEIASERDAKTAEDDGLAARAGAARDERDTVRGRTAEIEAQKADFMAQVDEYNKKKVAVESELSETVRAFEESDARLSAARRAVERIDEALPRVRAELAEAERAAADAAGQAEGMRAELAEAESARAGADGRAAEANARRDALLARQAEALRAKSEADSRASEIAGRLGEARLGASRARARLADVEDKERENSERHGLYEAQHAKLLGLRGRLESVRANHAASVEAVDGRMSGLKARRERTVRDMDDLSLLLDKSTSAGSKFDAKIKLVKDIMHEDYSAARLRDNAGRLGVIGLAYELLEWDKEHERAVLAASSDWLKATVVRDFATLVGLAEFVRDRRLPKLKIIPLDALPDVSMDAPEGPGVLGVLSSFVRCKDDHARLKSFLLGGVVVARTKDDAYALSRRGYRAVTVAGEFFESNAAAVVVDVNSRISKLTKIISMSTSVEGLLRSIGLLRRHMERKKAEMRRLDADIERHASRREVSRAMLADADRGLEDLEWQTGQRGSTLGRLSERLAGLAAERGRLLADAEAHESAASALESEASDAALAAEGAADLGAIAADLEAADAERLAVEGERAGAVEAYSRASKMAADLGAAATAALRRAETLRGEDAAASSERAGHESGIEGLAAARDDARRRLDALREREQEVIESGGAWASTIKDYDGALSDLNAKDKDLTRLINTAERASDSLRRDLEGLDGEEARLRVVLSRAGFGDAEAAAAAEAGAGEAPGGAGAGDALQTVRDLEAEMRSLGDLNAKAPESYARVSVGYRSMSARRNELEAERNKIVEFIESVEKGKRQTFLDAFDKVDKEIRIAFSAMMDGGNAWLELENEDDIFSSGILYMLQFPGKPKRESTSTSGGEKTLAAVVFALALQQLRPSPFYIFDEIDASLDGPNAQRLAGILKKRSESSQFIMVSHKDILISKADQVYGVFPKAGGASHVVKYNRRRLPPPGPQAPAAA